VEKTAFVVLGMHRSGTSSVAGTLAMLGATPPKTLLQPSDDNPRGFWESWEIIQQNDRILQAGESWWNDWRRFDERKISEAARQAIEADIRATLFREFGDSETVVIKDPRCCRLWSFWEPALKSAGYNALYVMPVRSPIEVARSLNVRNGFSLPEGQILWLRHVLDAERSTRGKPRLISSWMTFISDWRKEIARAEVTLEWRAPSLHGAEASKVDEFIHPDLRRQRASGDEDPESHPWAQEVFALMMRLAKEDTRDTWRKLDALSARFEIASDLYGGALGPVLWNAHTSLVREAERNQAQSEVVRLQEQVALLRSESATSNESVKELQQALASVHAEAERLENELAQAKNIEILLAAQIAALESAHIGLVEAHERSQREADRQLAALEQAMRDETKKHELSSEALRRDAAQRVAELEARNREMALLHAQAIKELGALRSSLAQNPIRTAWAAWTRREAGGDSA
jgi:hypothetical protein